MKITYLIFILIIQTHSDCPFPFENNNFNGFCNFSFMCLLSPNYNKFNINITISQNFFSKNNSCLLFENRSIEISNKTVTKFENFDIYFRNFQEISLLIIRESSSLIFVNCTLHFLEIGTAIFSENTQNLVFDNVEINFPTSNKNSNTLFFVEILLANQLIIEKLTIINKELMNFLRIKAINLIFIKNLNIFKSKITLFIDLYEFVMFFLEKINFSENTINSFIKIENNVNTTNEIIIKNSKFIKNVGINNFYLFEIFGNSINIFFENLFFSKNFDFISFTLEKTYILNIQKLIIENNTDFCLINLKNVIKFYLNTLIFQENTSKLFDFNAFYLENNNDVLTNWNFNDIYFLYNTNFNLNLKNGLCLTIKYNGRLILFDSFFLGNSIIGGNPLINNLKSNGDSELYINNSSFIENKATSISNCIYFIGKSIIIENSYFLNNSGTSYGIFYLFSPNGVFKNLIFKFCSSRIGSAFSLFLTQDSTNYHFTSIIFLKNSAQKSIFYLYTLFPFEILIENSFFSLNSVQEQGGIFFIKYIYGDPEKYILLINDSIFSNNFALKSGGVGEFWQIGGSITITECIFLENQANEGGVLNVNSESNTILTFQFCFFGFNVGFKQAGVFNLLLGNFIMRECFFFSNTSPFAAIIFVSTYSETLIERIKIHTSYDISEGNLVFLGKSINYFSDSIIYNSSGKICAGVLISGLSSLSLNNIVFERNSAQKATLLLISSSFVIISIENLSCDSNNATTGALFEFSFAKAFLNNLTFHNNFGILFEIHRAQITIEEVISENNICFQSQKGCFLKIEENGTVYGNNLKIFNTFSFSNDGIFYLKSSFCSINQGYFRGIRTFSGAEIVYSEKSEFLCYFCLIKNFSNTAFLIFKNTKFVFEFGVCENEILKSGGCLNISDTQIMIITNSNFSNIKSNVILIEKTNEFYNNNINILNLSIISYCNFYDNSLVNFQSFSVTNFKKGSCILLKNSELKLLYSNFINNIADTGGALYLSSRNLINYININIYIYIENCIFINNSALSSGGGAIFWDYKLPNLLKSNIFRDNKALYGSNIASKPLKFKIINQFFNAIVSGGDYSIILELIDYYEQRVTVLDDYEEHKEAIISFKEIYDRKINNYREVPYPNNKMILGINLLEFNNGFFNFLNLKLIALPNNYHTLTIFTALIKNNDIELIKNKTEHDFFIKNQYNFAINVTFEDCRSGEIFNNEKNMCEKCRFGEFSIDPMDNQCSRCPDYSICTGGNEIIINAGYWRNSVNSTKIYICKSKNSCLGGYNSTCSSGFSGILCDTCIYEKNEYYFKNFDGLCNKCENNKSGYIVIAFFLLFLVSYQAFTIKLKMKTMDFKRSSIMKILLNYFQLISIVNNLDLTFPGGMTSMFKFQAQVNNPKNTINPVNCIYAAFTLEIDIYFINNVVICLFSLIYPFMFMILVYFFSLIQKLKSEKRRYLRTISLLVICYTLQPLLLNFFFQNFDCFEIEGKKYVQNYLKQECWNESHLLLIKLYILPFLLFWSSFLPLLAFFLLQKSRKKVMGEYMETSNPFSFLIDGYRGKTFYWEFFILIQRVIIIIINIFLRNKNLLIMIALCFLFIFIIFQIILKPFKTNLLNRLQLTAYLVSFLTILISLCLRNTIVDFSEIIFYYSIYGSNMIFLIFWSFCFIESNKANLIKIKMWIQNSCPWFLNFMHSSFRKMSSSGRKSSKNRNARTGLRRISSTRIIMIGTDK